LPRTSASRRSKSSTAPSPYRSGRTSSPSASAAARSRSGGGRAAPRPQPALAAPHDVAPLPFGHRRSLIRAELDRAARPPGRRSHPQPAFPRVGAVGATASVHGVPSRGPGRGRGITSRSAGCDTSMGGNRYSFTITYGPSYKSRNTGTISGNRLKGSFQGHQWHRRELHRDAPPLTGSRVAARELMVAAIRRPCSRPERPAPPGSAWRAGRLARRYGPRR